MFFNTCSTPSTRGRLLLFIVKLCNSNWIIFYLSVTIPDQLKLGLIGVNDSYKGIICLRAHSFQRVISPTHGDKNDRKRKRLFLFDHSFTPHVIYVPLKSNLIWSFLHSPHVLSRQNPDKWSQMFIPKSGLVSPFGESPFISDNNMTCSYLFSGSPFFRIISH